VYTCRNHLYITDLPRKNESRKNAVSQDICCSMDEPRLSPLDTTTTTSTRREDFHCFVCHCSIGGITSQDTIDSVTTLRALSKTPIVQSRFYCSWWKVITWIAHSSSFPYRISSYIHSPAHRLYSIIISNISRTSHLSPQRMRPLLSYCPPWPPL